MTQKSLGEPAMGSVNRNTREVYGPDPWCYNGSWFCWFSIDAYIKDYGSPPEYVSNSDRKALGL